MNGLNQGSEGGHLSPLGGSPVQNAPLLAQRVSPRLVDVLLSQEGQEEVVNLLRSVISRLINSHLEKEGPESIIEHLLAPNIQDGHNSSVFDLGMVLGIGGVVLQPHERVGVHNRESEVTPPPPSPRYT